MNLSDYIASGVLELYVLDRLEPAKRREVEAYATEHPEIREEIMRIEETLEVFVRAQAPPAPPAALDRVLERIRQTPPPRTVDPVKDTNSGGLSVWIGLLLFALAAAAAVHYWNQAETEREQNSELSNELKLLEQDCDEIRAANTELTERLAILASPATRSIILAGTPNAPDSRAIVYYNTRSNRTLFTADNLPPPPAGKQYQLWAIDADGPKSLGVLDLDMDTETLLDVDFIPETAAFAVSLEEAGGKDAPDMSAIQVIGEVL